MIETTFENGFGVIRIDHGPVNAMDADFFPALEKAMELAADARAAIITGKDGVFSAGADLKGVLRSDDEFVRARVADLSHAFMSVFRFPKPLVAAINGHAIAGGCVVACCADYRVMGTAGTIGLAELRVGVPFPTAALEIVRFAAGGPHLQELVYLGKNYAPEDALARGLVDEVVDAADVMSRSFAVADQLARIPERTFRQTKEALRAPTVERVEREAATRDPEAADTWVSEDGRGAIKSFLDSLRG